MRSLGRVRQAGVVAVLLLVLTLSLGGGVASKGTEGAATYEQLKLFTEVLSIVQNQYVDEVPPKDLIYNAIKGTLRGLDPHSSFLDPEMYREMQVETQGTFGGLGIEITLKDDILTVVAPIEGTPAHRAGIHAGDRIIRIEGIPTKDMALTDAVKRMRGKPGTKVTITVVRDDGKEPPRDVSIIREIIRVQSVRTQMLEPTIGYIRLRQFQEQTAQDLDAVIEKMMKAPLQGLVLDLRNNPGGLLQSAVDVTEKFLEDGRLVVYTEGRLKNQNMRFAARNRHPALGFPMVILVNNGSASASEIVAGALQDWGRALVVGTTSFGKASVQTIIPLSDGSGLRLTTAKYFTPKGRSIHSKGIEPDIVVELPKPSPNGQQQAEKEKPQPQVKPDDEWKQDVQITRAVDLLKAMRIMEKNRPAPSQAKQG